MRTEPAPIEKEEVRLLTPEVTEAIRERSMPLAEPHDLDALVEKIKDKQVVMLGEATHGTSEFYTWRAEISKILIRDHGFRFIAVEGDWPDSERITRYILNNEGENARQVLIQNHRWPTWMWANEETAEAIEWLKGQKVPFYGLDLYSFFESVSAAGSYLRGKHPEFQSSLENLDECLETFNGDGISYAKSLVYKPEGCLEDLAGLLRKLHMLRAEQMEHDSELFGAYQNARVALHAENYYRTMLHGDEKSWNVRDKHMMKTLKSLLEVREKGIVWAHNTHIGDYRATDMALHNLVNIGGLAREQLGADQVALVGFGTYEGKVVASHAWEGKELVLDIPPAWEGSYESHFHEVAVHKDVHTLYVLLDPKHADHPLNQEGGHRAIGVVYNPQRESRSQYVNTRLASRYDAFIFIDRTTALHSFRARPEKTLMPETYPMGQ
jgi:erythromycin esterase-like protein